MVISKLLGGLGNQMFQYALGKHLAILNKSELKLDITSFAKDPLRDYHLHCFAESQQIATLSEINKLKYGHANSKLAATSDFLNRLSRHLFGKKLIRNKSYIFEGQVFKFSPEILNISGDVYLEGYWQTYKYFADIRDILTQDFTLKNPVSGTNLEFLKQIRAENSISLHIRRGDYESNPNTKSLYACCNAYYYTKAIELIQKSIEQPKFFVFSDDPDWAADNLKIENKIIVRGNSSENAEEDLRLMQNCQHHIIANSSFSWWGAWLNKNPDKIVIAPKTWINLPIDTTELIPDNWLRI